MFPLAKGHEKISLALLTLIPLFFFYSLKYDGLVIFLPIIVFLLGGHLYFFRDPSRETVVDSKCIIAPADGKVYEIVPSKGIIRIRMSFLDIHVNRWPVSGVITSITRKSGQNWPLLPFLRQGTDRNSQQIIEISNEQGKFRVVQIAGILAQRCVTYYMEDDQISQGDRLGMIKYGSEVDIYFPAGKYDILVRKNDRTIAGFTALAKTKD